MIPKDEEESPNRIETSRSRTEGQGLRWRGIDTRVGRVSDARQIQQDPDGIRTAGGDAARSQAEPGAVPKRAQPNRSTDIDPEEAPAQAGNPSPQRVP